VKQGYRVGVPHLRMRMLRLASSFCLRPSCQLFENDCGIGQLTLPMNAGKKVLRPSTSTNFSQFAAPASVCMAYERTLIALVFANNFSLFISTSYM
jgi:hypothetical protein